MTKTTTIIKKRIGLTEVMFFRLCYPYSLLPLGPDEKNLIYFLLSPCTKKQITQYNAKRNGK